MAGPDPPPPQWGNYYARPAYEFGAEYYRSPYYQQAYPPHWQGGPPPAPAAASWGPGTAPKPATDSNVVPSVSASLPLDELRAPDAPGPSKAPLARHVVQVLELYAQNDPNPSPETLKQMAADLGQEPSVSRTGDRRPGTCTAHRHRADPRMSLHGSSCILKLHARYRALFVPGCAPRWFPDWAGRAVTISTDLLSESSSHRGSASHRRRPSNSACASGCA